MNRFLSFLWCLPLVACSALGPRPAESPHEGNPVRDATALERHCLMVGPTGVPTRTTVVMLLSPRMAYSLHEWPRMRAVAEESHFQVLALKDPRVPASEWDDALVASGLDSTDRQRLHDLPAECHSLWSRADHLPYSLVFLDSSVHTWPILGVMPNTAWRDSLEFRRRAFLHETSRSARQGSRLNREEPR